LLYRPESQRKAHEIFSDIKVQQDALLKLLPSTYEYLSYLHETEQSASRSPALRMSHLKQNIFGVEQQAEPASTTVAVS
jgi:hypothetical protein